MKGGSMRHCLQFFSVALSAIVCGNPHFAEPRSSTTYAEREIVAPGTVSGLPWEPSAGTAEQRVAAVLDYMRNVDLHAMRPLEAKKHEFPEPSIHVMRVKLHELYELDGIGTDKVELSGWIAVRQGAARPVRPASKATWRNGLVETEFVGLELRGESELFGPVEISLDPTTPAKGQVGSFALPEEAEATLLALANAKGPLAMHAGAGVRRSASVAPRALMDSSEAGTVYEQDLTPLASTSHLSIEQARALTQSIKSRLAVKSAGKCKSEVSVVIKVGQLDLEMRTMTPVVWYSSVDTVPPVGFTASVAMTPTPLLSEGRVVGTLVSGNVNFRELVLSVPLEVAAPRDQG
jgi:hypothetical protein